MKTNKIAILLFAVAVFSLFYINCFNNIKEWDLYFSFKPDSANMYFINGLFNQTLFVEDIFMLKLREIFSFFNFDIIVWGPYLLLLNFFSLPVSVKIISVFLGIASTAAIYKTGRYLYSVKNAVFLTFLYMGLFFSTDIFIGGQPRAFGGFLYSVFLYFLVKKKYKVLPLVAFLMLICYPSVSIGLVTICLMVFFFQDERFSRKKIYLSGIVIVAAAVLLFGFGFNSLFGIIGFISNAAVDNLSLFGDYKYTQGVDYVLSLFSINDVLRHFVLNENEYTVQYVYLLRVFLAVSFGFFIFRRKAALILPREIWIMLLGSILSFLAVFIIHPVAASRQLVFSLPLFLIFFIGQNISAFKIRRFIFFPIVFSLLGYLFIAHSHYNATLSHKKYKPLYDYCSGLDKDIIIAGFPESLLLSSVPMYSKRPVFYLDDTRDMTLVALSSDQQKKRKKDLINTLYAESRADILDFIDRYNIDYFLVESRFYEKEFLTEREKGLDSKYRQSLQGSELLSIAKLRYDFVLKLDFNNTYLLSAESINNEK